ncbi:T9SS type A sorting domain-containing protein [Chryseobacterium echinoideorum]|uniref:T9SS type A sorting domain-containing protein n=1 Tax=Chryseobacterium echinoideorum TaxID=1549648 RepID=UPI00118494E5|nr:T9SS type A sorting domain-containing protein [Chryseobacterium echinoideorum]
MIIPLLIFNSKKNNCIVKQNALLICFFIIAIISGNVNAQTSKIVPENFVTGAFIGPLTNSARNNQLLIDDSQLTTLSGKYLTSISFRLPTTASNPWPASVTTFSDYQIYLSDSVDPVNRQFNFAANVVGTQTQVRAGSLVIPAGSFTVGGNPNNFTFDIVFDTPYLYTGTNLLIEIRHTGSDGTSASTHSSGTSSTGYGTLFSACWQQSSGTIVQANFSYVKINAVDALGVKSVEFDDTFSVYPNPVKDYLYVKSARDVVEFNVFNMAGQKVYSQKDISRTPQLNVSSLSKGNYILQIIDQDGNSKTTKFIKD